MIINRGDIRSFIPDIPELVCCPEDKLLFTDIIVERISLKEERKSVDEDSEVLP